jgi:OOP family OmpA-OmpF porin
MKKILLVAVALTALPFAAHAQNQAGFYVGARGGADWLLNNSANINGSATVKGFGTGAISGPVNTTFNTGWVAGGFVGYDFVGPRLEVEVLYHDNMGTGSATLPILGVGDLRLNNKVEVQQTSMMADLYYDFFANEVFTPYIGAGAGIAFVNTRIGELTNSSDTEFAYEAIVGAGYKVTRNVRLNLDARYYGTLNPTFNNSFNLPGATVPVSGNISGSYPNNNFAVLASIVFKFDTPSP